MVPHALLCSHVITEAITLANATRFGLAASAWTTDAAEQARFTELLEPAAPDPAAADRLADALRTFERSR